MDAQPFSIVENVGFRELITKLDPSYILPTRQALKAMVGKNYQQSMQIAKIDVKKAPAVSLTADMWTSIHMDAYLAVTCHYIGENHEVCKTLLGVWPFPKAHTAENLAEVKNSLMEEWGIQGRVRCTVTDAAATMIACVNVSKLRLAHALNLVIKKSLDQTSGPGDIRVRARRPVSYLGPVQLPKKSWLRGSSRWDSLHKNLSFILTPDGTARLTCSSDCTRRESLWVQH